MQRLKPKDLLKWLRRKLARVYTHAHTHTKTPYSLIYSTCSSRRTPRKTYLLCSYLSSLSTHNDPELTLGRCRVFLFFTFPILSHPPCFVMHLTMEGYILGPGLGLRALWLLPLPLLSRPPTQDLKGINRSDAEIKNRCFCVKETEPRS